MNKWKEHKLGDIISIKHGWAFKSQFHSENSLNNAPILVSIGNFKYTGGFRFNSTKIKYYTGEYPLDYILKAGDILLIMTCQTEGGEILGIPGIVPNDNKLYLHNQRLGKVIFKSNFIDKKFLYWFFLSKQFNQSLFASSTGTKILHTAPNRIENVDILLPPLEEQVAIANTLSNLDNKLNLLDHQNKIIEKLIQTLFRQWFIEEVKDEWEEKPLSEIANFLNGLACQKFPPKNDVDKLPVLKIKDLKAGISDSSDWATTDIKPEYIIESGDVIFAWSASLIVKIWDGEKCILNQHLFKVTSDDYPKWFYYQWCKYHLDRFIAIAQAHATTMGHIKRKDLDNAMCFVPSADEIKVMDEQIVPLMQKLENNSKQIKTLENMRDILLPKLMSGVVRVVT